MSHFVNNKPSRVQLFNAFKNMEHLSVLVVSYGDCRDSPDDEVEIYLDFEIMVEPTQVINLVHSLNLVCKKQFIKCDGQRTKLIHISRQDTELVFQGIDTDSFSEHYHKLKFMRESFTSKSGELDFNHRFLSEHKQNMNALVRAYKQYVENNTIKIEHFLIKNKYKGWQHKVIEWYNNYIINAGSNEQVRQLYLYGKSGVGKSSFIYHVFGRRFGRQIFRPLTSDDSKKYQWESFSSKLYNFVIVDEFDFRDVTLSLWKQACEGKEFKALVRYQPEGNHVNVSVPFIMISNYAPLETVTSHVEHDPILKRLVVVEVDVRDETGKEPVEYISQIDSTRGLTLEEVIAMSDCEKTTLSLARLRNRETYQIATSSKYLSVSNCQEQAILTVNENIIVNEDQTEKILHKHESANIDSAISETSTLNTNEKSLADTINAAFNLPVEVLKALLKRKQSKDDLDMNSIKKMCYHQNEEINSKKSNNQESKSNEDSSSIEDNDNKEIISDDKYNDESTTSTIRKDLKQKANLVDDKIK